MFSFVHLVYYRISIHKGSDDEYFYAKTSGGVQTILKRFSLLNNQAHDVHKLESQMRRHDKSDRRTQRTDQKLTTAMVELITEKRFDDVTVQNLIDRAQVGRSTFYSHYRDKQDLFRKDWERFIEMLAQRIN